MLAFLSATKRPYVTIRPRPLVVSCRASVSSFQTKVIIETLERMCNRLVYDPRKYLVTTCTIDETTDCPPDDYESGIEESFHDECDFDVFLILQVFIIISVGIALCILNKKDKNGS